MINETFIKKNKIKNESDVFLARRFLHLIHLREIKVANLIERFFSLYNKILRVIYRHHKPHR